MRIFPNIFARESEEKNDNQDETDKKFKKILNISFLMASSSVDIIIRRVIQCKNNADEVMKSKKAKI